MSTTFSRTRSDVRVPEAGTWSIDPAHSSITAVARHLMVTKVRGTFSSFDGAVHIDAEPQRSWVEVEVDASSIDTRNPGRDDHLRSPDFLDVATHPTIGFRSTGLRTTGDDTFDLDGELTIRGVTAPITLRATYLGQHTTPDGRSVVAFNASGELDREAFGITWNVALETGGVLVGRKIGIELEVQAVRQA